jgi:hypothetical protein
VAPAPRFPRLRLPAPPKGSCGFRPPSPPGSGSGPRFPRLRLPAPERPSGVCGVCLRGQVSSIRVSTFVFVCFVSLTALLTAWARLRPPFQLLLLPPVLPAAALAPRSSRQRLWPPVPPAAALAPGPPPGSGSCPRFPRPDPSLPSAGPDSLGRTRVFPRPDPSPPSAGPESSLGRIRFPRPDPSLPS